MAACITVRPIEEPADLAFLFEVYAGTRLEELAVTGWSPAEIEAFLHMQFSAQHAYYGDNYPDAELQIILAADRPAGRLYVNHGAQEIRLMDLALLPAYRGQGIGSSLLAAGALWLYKVPAVAGWRSAHASA